MNSTSFLFVSLIGASIFFAGEKVESRKVRLPHIGGLKRSASLAEKKNVIQRTSEKSHARKPETGAELWSREIIDILMETKRESNDVPDCSRLPPINIRATTTASVNHHRPTTTEAACPPGRLRCADDSRCILQNFVCDGDYDCTDRSDEVNCDKIDVPQCKEVQTTSVPATVTSPEVDATDDSKLDDVQSGSSGDKDDDDEYEDESGEKDEDDDGDNDLFGSGLNGGRFRKSKTSHRGA